MGGSKGRKKHRRGKENRGVGNEKEYLEGRKERECEVGWQPSQLFTRFS